MKVVVLTLGCKVNEYESGSMITQLARAGYETSTNLEVADFYIINSCAVTNIAERKSRQMIAKILKVNKDAKILVCGCAAQNNFSQFTNFPNVKNIMGNFGKGGIVEKLNETFSGSLIDIPKDYEKMEFATETRTRKYIKIQDGCDNFCSYCVIPYTRGRSRSRDMAEIIDEIKSSSAKEIVLTGINVSDYRINGRLALIDLLEEIDKLGVRFRLSSLECVIIDDDFILRLSRLKNFCPLFHLSLQSACNETLKRMNRHYTIEFFISVCEKIKKAFKDACISTDLIVGFKGETDEEFETTLNNLKKIPFAFIHIFPYSIRKGTNAEKLGGDVPKNVVKLREKRLSEYNDEIYKKFLEENLNSHLDVLIEEKKGEYFVGYSKNYIYTYIKADSLRESLKKNSLNEFVKEDDFDESFKDTYSKARGDVSKYKDSNESLSVGDIVKVTARSLYLDGVLADLD